LTYYHFPDKADVIMQFSSGRVYQVEKHRVCPWWLGYFLASSIRKIWQDPAAILEPHVRSGMTVFEPGPGMGFFTRELARRVGPSGRVIAADIQPRMLGALARQLRKAGLERRVETRLVSPASTETADLNGAVDFILAFAVLHEMPSAEAFFRQAAELLKPGARLLLVEPAEHVKVDRFEAQLILARGAGLRDVGRPAIRCSRAALLEKP
jgi:SAM-dependent methyltransferase